MNLLHGKVRPQQQHAVELRLRARHSHDRQENRGVEAYAKEDELPEGMIRRQSQIEEAERHLDGEVQEVYEDLLNEEDLDTA